MLICRLSCDDSVVWVEFINLEDVGVWVGELCFTLILLVVADCSDKYIWEHVTWSTCCDRYDVMWDAEVLSHDSDGEMSYWPHTSRAVIGTLDYQCDTCRLGISFRIRVHDIGVMYVGCSDWEVVMNMWDYILISLTHALCILLCLIAPLTACPTYELSFRTFYSTSGTLWFPYLS